MHNDFTEAHLEYDLSEDDFFKVAHVLEDWLAR
jgi:hypothetical protein